MKCKMRLSYIRPLATAITLVIAMLALAPAALAQKDTVYTITVPVDVTAATASEARARAIEQGQHQALFMLLQRLTQVNDPARLPQVNPETVPFLVDSFSIYNEQTSSIRYKADLTVNFKPDEINPLLESAGLAFVSEPAPPVLIIPVYQSNSQLMLWEDYNPWAQAWSADRIKNNFTPVILPLADLTDITSLTARQALDHDSDALAAIARRYNVEYVLVAHAQSSDDLQNFSVTLSGETAAGRVNYQTTTQPDYGEPYSAPGKATRDIIAHLESEWRRAATVSANAPEQSLAVLLSYSSLAEWIALRRELENMPMISKLTGLTITISNAEALIYYKGTLSSLQDQLRRKRLTMVYSYDGWRILRQ